ncbi:secreted protein with long stretch of threonines mucin [Cryptosporidium ryanae]|uniref:secreted protein with long stretch of threonines mucin n=1 Tax=Cryptosporidium ryanae TaxID=515981 RepID=UPI00351A8A86|nr:secreted protein with long stretch of threonines mucin [Cryptosporidium ryanae]
MAFVLNSEQIEKLGTVLKDERNEKDLEYSATIVCRYSDILFGESEENRSQKLCCCDKKGEISISCKERSMLIRVGFIASMRQIKSEKVVSSQTMAKVIRIARRLLRGANWLPIDCMVQREMIEGLSLLIRILNDFNSIRVLQGLLSSYLFWCYMQSEDKFVVNNSKLLLCVTTWLKEGNTNKNLDEIQNNDQKYGLTQASLELMNRIVGDFDISSKQYLKEYKLTLELNNCSSNKETNELIELKKRTIKDLKLICALIKYSGVYTHGNICKHHKNVSDTKNMSTSNNKMLVGTAIIPQILELLTKLRSYTLELVNCLLSYYLENLSTGCGKYELIDLLELLNIIITVRDGNENQIKSFIGVTNSDNNLEFVNKLNYITDLIDIGNEMLFNVLECTSITGITIYSPLIQNYILNIFSLECNPSNIIKDSAERERCHAFFSNYYSSVIFILMGVPIFHNSFKECNYEVFLTLKSCIGILRFYEKLFTEILKVQEYVLSLVNDSEIYIKNNSIFCNNSHHYNTGLISKKINELLLKSMNVYELSVLVILEFRNTRIAREINRVQNIQKLMTSCHLLSINLLYNIVVNNCQVYSKLSDFNNVGDYSAKSNKKNNMLIELSYCIINVIMLYYSDTKIDMNSTLLERIYNIIKHLQFIFNGNFIDERFFDIFSFVSNKLYCLKQYDDDSGNDLIKRRNLKKSFIEDESVVFMDTDENEEFQLDFLLDRNIPIESLNRDEDSLVDYKSEENTHSQLKDEVKDVIMDIKQVECDEKNQEDKNSDFYDNSNKNEQKTNDSRFNIENDNFELNMESSSSENED